jgi:hypothetical protein
MLSSIIMPTGHKTAPGAVPQQGTGTVDAPASALRPLPVIVCFIAAPHSCGLG